MNSQVHPIVFYKMPSSLGLVWQEGSLAYYLGFIWLQNQDIVQWEWERPWDRSPAKSVQNLFWRVCLTKRQKRDCFNNLLSMWETCVQIMVAVQQQQTHPNYRYKKKGRLEATIIPSKHPKCLSFLHKQIISSANYTLTCLRLSWVWNPNNHVTFSPTCFLSPFKDPNF
jgi:hypothetical protein